MNEHITRLCVVVLAIICAFVANEYLMKPVVLDSMCLVNTNDCVWIQYWSYKNTALISMQPTGYWIFFDGQTAFTYGTQLSQQFSCQALDGIQYEPAYEFNISTGLPTGFKCLLALATVRSFYDKKGIQAENIYVRTDTAKFDVRAALNKLQDNGVLNMSRVLNK